MTELNPPRAPDFDAGWIDAAHRSLSRLLRLDYLSGGAGHRQSHRALAERAARRALHDAAPLRHPGPRTRDSQALYLRRVAACTRLSSSEEYRLAVRMRRGDVQARNALLQANLGLAVMFAQRWRDCGVPLLDLIAEGNLGLLAATREFDPERGFRFSTYAKWYVRQAIGRAVPRLARVVRVPDEEAAGAHAPEPGAAPLNPLHDCEPVDYQQLAAPDELEPPAQAWSGQQQRLLWQALEALDERQRRIVCQRWGLGGQPTQTLQALAGALGVSIERVRQLEAAALKRMGDHLRERGLGHG